jgi:hypothetical protein
MAGMVIVVHIDDESLIRRLFERAGNSLDGIGWRPFDGQNEEAIIVAIETAAAQGDAVVYLSDRQITPAKGTARFNYGEKLWETVWAGLSDDGRKVIRRFVSYCSSPGDEALREVLPAELRATAGAIYKPLTVSEFFAQFLPMIESL